MRRWLLTRRSSVRPIGPRHAVAAAATVLVAAALAGVVATRHARPEEARGGARGDGVLRVETDLPGAALAVDGTSRGLTPTSVALSPGHHHVLVSHPFAVSQQLDLEIKPGASAYLDVPLWRLPPSVLPIRAPLPGARIGGFTFLRDGRLVMTVAIPPGDDLEPWLLDRSGAARRITASSLHGVLALSPDGRIATLTFAPQANGTIRYDGVQLFPADGTAERTVVRLHGQDQREDLQSLAWSPDGRALLVAATQRTAAGVTGSRLLMRDLASDDAAPTRELLSMPATIVDGTMCWSPAGGWVAFVARAQGADTLVAVDTRSGQVRSLGDLGQAAAPSAPFPPLDWSPDGRRLLFAAPDGEPASRSVWLLPARRPAVLWVFDTATGAVQRLGSASGRAPTWHGAGPALAFARSGATNAVTLEDVGSDGRAHDVARLPIATEGLLSALWDDAHGQAVLATSATIATDPGAVAFWWLRFLPGGGEHA